MHRLLEYLYLTQQAVIHYAAVSMRPNLKDRVLQVYYPVQTATTMLMTSSALMLQSMSQGVRYVNKPDECEHPSGLRSYGAGKVKVRICDLCGARWVVEKMGLVPAQRKATPTSKTPLHEIKTKAKSKAASNTRSAGSWDEDFGGYSRPSWPQAHAPPPRTSTSTSRMPPTSRAKAKAPPSRPLIGGMTEQEVYEMTLRFEDMQQELHWRREQAELYADPEDAPWTEAEPFPGEFDEEMDHYEEDEEEELLTAG